MNEEITTIAARCPKCKKYHLVGRKDLAATDKVFKKELAYFAANGFDIVHITTEDARNNFSYC